MQVCILPLLELIQHYCTNYHCCRISLVVACVNRERPPSGGWRGLSCGNNILMRIHLFLLNATVWINFYFCAFKQFHQQPYDYHNHKEHHPTTMTHNTTNYAIPDQLLVSLLKAWLCECRFCVFFSRCCAFIPTRAFSACATYSRWLRHKVTTAGRFVASASLWWWIHKPLLFANLGKVLKFLKRGDEVKMEYLLNIYSEAVDNKNDHVVE